MNPSLLDENVRVVGMKQVLRLVSRGEAEEVFIAKDIGAAYIEEILPVCQKAGVPVCWAETKAELGKLCGIAVGASAAALRKPEE